MVFSIVVSALAVAPGLPREDWFTPQGISLALGTAALALMGIAALLSARLRMVETLFGGLDRVYLAHKWLGIWALALASFHLVYHADRDNWSTAAILVVPDEMTRFVRHFCYVGLMLIVMLALNRTIPYRVWRWWHKLSGPLFLVVVLHWLSIESPIALASPAGLWLALTATAGTAGALYKLLLYRHLAGQAEYRVVATTPGKAAIHLELAPVGKRLAFQPGQFGFLRLKAHGLREPHPFTLASGTHPDGHVDFVIRALGDYTSQLVKTIRVGMLADIHAPHGRFTRNRKARREVWIGGGVGISPFIAWLRDEEAGSCEQVTLFYFHTPGRAFPDVQALEDLAIARGAELVPVPDGPDSPAFRQRFAAIVREIDPQAVDVAFCGPVGLLDEVRARMRHEGVPMANLRHEHFNFR